MRASRTSPNAGRAGRLAAAAAVLAAALAVLAGLAVTLTQLDTHAGRPGAAPGWATPCYGNEPRPDRELLERCALATGVVAHVREQGRAESHEIHFALLGRFGALIVKLGDPDALRAPAVGARVTVVGPMVRASNGMREIQAWSLRPARQ